jgi:c-di-GMP-binding flagellar brake protein YcgR
VKIKSGLDPQNFKMATLSDISMSGALVSTARPLGAAGDMIDIEFSLRDQASDQDVTITTTASIRSVQQSAGSTADGASFLTVYSHGINFHDINTANQVILQNFVYETLLIHRT